MTSCCSRDYGSDDVRGDILVKDGHFVGVVIFTTEELCSSWSKYRNIYYSLLFIDGKVDGKPIKTYTFSGESSSKDYTNEYSLVKNEK
jgi:hypothetical protein